MWGQIDWEKTDKSRLLGIWDEFADKIAAIARTTNRYEVFVERLCGEMGVRSLRFRDVNDIQQQDDLFKKAVVKILREETRPLVLEVRLNNQVRKEQAQLKKEKEEQEKKQKELETEQAMNKQVSFTEKGDAVVE